MGKGKNNHKTRRDIKAQKRNDRKNLAFNTLLNNQSNLKYKSQNFTTPKLISQKQKIIDELNRKQKTGARQQLIENLNQKLNDKNPSEYINLYQLMEDSKSNQKLYNVDSDQNLVSNQEKKNSEKKLNVINKDLSRKLYIKILEQVLENSDVILEVLDARDPLSCRSKEIENKINLIKNKKIILVLNKIDLIPLQNAIDWQKYLSKEYPCVLFKSNTQTQNTNLSQSNLFDKNLKEQKDYINEILKSNKTIGSEELLNILKNYARIDVNTKSNITVGVIGIPNVGKSSLINSMTRGKNVGVSNTPGYTKGLQEVILDNNLRLLDCPGVVMTNDENNILHNIIRTEDIKEPLDVVGKIMKKMNQEYFLKTYDVDIKVLKGSELTVEKIMYLVGEKLKKYKKGGIVDLDKTARIVINDWNLGKLKYYSVPPGIDKNIYDQQINALNVNQNNKNMVIDK